MLKPFRTVVTGMCAADAQPLERKRAKPKRATVTTKGASISEAGALWTADEVS